jgi:hypothetical protein
MTAEENVGIRYLEDKSVVPNIDRSHKDTLQDLIILFIFSRANINQFPF